MTTLSYDIRVSVNARDTYIEQIGFMRTVEHQVRKSFEVLEFQRTLEWLSKQSTEDISWYRTTEHKIAGSLSNIEWDRTIEYMAYGLQSFASGQARNIIKTISSADSVRTISRDLIFLKNPKFTYEYDIRTSVNAKTVRAGEGFSVVLENSGGSSSQNLLQKVENQAQPTQQIDACVQFNWTGTFNKDSRFGVGFRQNGGTIKAIDLALPIVTSPNPTLSWSGIYNPESDQQIEYRLQLSSDIRFKRIIKDVTLSGTSYVVQNGISSYGTYYWRVKSYDKFNSVYLNESEWSNIFEFEYKETKISVVPSEFTISWESQFLLPEGQQHYLFNTKNLPSRDSNGNFFNYEFCVIYYQFNESRTAVSSPIPSSNSSQFIIDHRSANPPMFLSSTYDEQTHHVAMNVMIDDSMGRIYRLKDFYYLDRINPNNEWVYIDDFRIVGQKDNLNSRPNFYNRGLITWGASADPDLLIDQDLDYNVRILGESEHKNNDFFYFIEDLESENPIDILSLEKDDFGPWWNKPFGLDDLPRIIPKTTLDENFDIECAPILTESNTNQVLLGIRNGIHEGIVVPLDSSNIHFFEYLRGFEPSSVISSGVLSTEYDSVLNGGKLFDLRKAVYSLLPELKSGDVFHLDVMVCHEGESVPVSRFSTLFNPEMFFYREEVVDWIPISTHGITWSSVWSKLFLFLPSSEYGEETINVIIKMAIFGEGSYLGRSFQWVKANQGEMFDESLAKKYLRPAIHHSGIYNALVYYGKSTTYLLRHKLVSSSGISEWSEISKNYAIPSYTTSNAPKIWKSPAFYFFETNLNTPDLFYLKADIQNLYLVVENSGLYYKFQVEENGVWKDLEDQFSGECIYQKWVRLVLDTTNPACSTYDPQTGIFLFAVKVGTSGSVIYAADTGEGTGSSRVIVQGSNFYSSNISTYGGDGLLSYREDGSKDLIKTNRIESANSNTGLDIFLKNTYYVESFTIRYSIIPTGFTKIACWNNNNKVAEYKYISSVELVEFPIRDYCSKITVEIESYSGFSVSDISVMAYSLVPKSYPIQKNRLRFINSEETDIVMKNLLIDISGYYDHVGLPYPWEKYIVDPSEIMEDQDVELQKITKYGMLLRYRISLFRDEEALELLYSKVSPATKEIELTNVELYLEKVTNVVLDAKNIKPTFYELTYANIKMIEEKIGSSDYWIACRSKDYWFNGVSSVPIQYSNWSAFAKQKNTNIYTIFWNIRGMSIDPSSHLYIKCVAVLSSSGEDVEMPIFGFLPKANIDLRKAIVENTSNLALKYQADKKVLEMEKNIEDVFIGEILTIDF